KLFTVPSSEEQQKIPFARVNHNKYMVTDRTAYVDCSKTLKMDYRLRLIIEFICGLAIMSVSLPKLILIIESISLIAVLGTIGSFVRLEDRAMPEGRIQ
ncbi:hypothetical protein OSTOST_06890, partial [Ostertagia ostertagi]